MRHIERPDIPKKLAKYQSKWQAVFEKSGRKHPSSSQYGCDEVRDLLKLYSFNKCFFCECNLDIGQSHIDHFIEVSVNKSLAFCWENLYLSCPSCNLEKIDHNSIPVDTVLDPCKDSNDEIKQHIIYKKEIISGLTEKGRETIRKFNLADSERITCRIRHLQTITEEYCRIRDVMDSQNRTVPNDSEINRLKSFANDDQPYSLMSEFFIYDKFSLFLNRK